MAVSIDINEYLNKPIICDCGKEHRINLKKVDIGFGAKDRVSDVVKELGYKHLFVVCDVNTYEAAGKYVVENLEENDIDYDLFIYQDKELVPDETSIGRIFQRITKEVDLIVAVGTGTINDLCKYTSYQLSLDYIVFASAPSMDGFVSDGAALVTDHVKTTYHAHVPVAVIGDVDILTNAPIKMIVAGLGDILGKYTCLLDWKLANIINGEYICDWVVNLVRSAIETCVKYGYKIKDRDQIAIQAIMEALVLSGVCMSFVGNSRPASGSEHHLSHYWEMQFQMENKKPVLHGIKVGVGMIASIFMYQRLKKETPNFNDLKNIKFDYDAWENKVKECYKDASTGIISLENKVKKNDIDKRNNRLDIMKEKWNDITRLIDEDLPKLDEIEQLMFELNAPINPKQIGVSSTLVKDAIVLAKEVRDRFTILQVLWDLNLLEDYAKLTVDYFENIQQLKRAN